MALGGAEWGWVGLGGAEWGWLGLGGGRTGQDGAELNWIEPD